MASNLNFELSLQQMSAIKTAIDLWSHQSIKKKINEYLKNNGPNSFNKTKKLKTELYNELIEQVKKKNLPPSIKSFLMNVIKPIGDRLFNYLHRLQIEIDHREIGQEENTYPSVNDYYNKIKWTSIGTVDEINVFKDIYYQIPDDEITNMAYIFMEACNYCLKKCIKNIWNKCTSKEKESIDNYIKSKSSFDVSKNYIYWKRQIHGKKSNAYKQLQSISNIDAFKSCISVGNYEGVKYFFNELNQNEKNNNIIILADKLLDDYVRVITHPNEFVMYMALNIKPKIDILIFLITNMSINDKLKFIRKNINTIIDIFVKEWPWSNSFIDILDLYEFDQLELCKLILTIMNIIIDEYDYIKSTSLTSLWMLVYTYNKISIDDKISLVELFWTLSKPLSYKLQAIAFIVSVIDDTDGINENYDDICKGFNKICNQILIKEHYEIIDIFMDKILKTEQEKINFLKNIKSKIICRRFIIYGEYKKLNKFINWLYFNNDNAKVSFKQEFKKDDFCLTIICRIMNSCKNLRVDKIKPIFDKYFNWFNYSTQELNKLKEKMKTNRQVEIHLKRYYLKCPCLYTTLLTCCSFTSEEIEQMKIQITKETDKNSTITTKTTPTPKKKTHIKIICK